MTKLTKLDFSTPKPYYESYASLPNYTEQEVRLRVTGNKKAEVETFINNLLVSCEVVSGEPIPLPETESFVSEIESELEEILETPTDEPEDLSSIKFELVINKAELLENEQPSSLKFNWQASLNRPIMLLEKVVDSNSPAFGGPILAIKCEATVEVTAMGPVYAEITGGIAQGKCPYQATVRQGDCPVKLYKQSQNSQKVEFSLKITSSFKAVVSVTQKMWNIV